MVTTAEDLLASILTDQATMLEAHAHAMEQNADQLQEHAATLRRMVRELGETDVHQKPDGPESSPGRPN